MPDSFSHAEEFGVVEFGVGPFGEAAFGLFHFKFQFFDGRLVTCGELGRLVARKAVGHQFGALSGVSAAPFLDVVGKAAEGRSDFVGRSEFREFGKACDQFSASFDVAVGLGKGPRQGVGVALAAGGQQQRRGEEPDGR